VVGAPVDVLAISLNGIPFQGGRTVLFTQPNQLVKRAEAAKIAGVSTSTLKRAEVDGELRAIKVSERDTSYFMFDLCYCGDDRAGSLGGECRWVP
jgi:hypothetical protein